MSKLHGKADFIFRVKKALEREKKIHVERENFGIDAAPVAYFRQDVINYVAWLMQSRRTLRTCYYGTSKMVNNLVTRFSRKFLTNFLVIMKKLLI